MQVGRIDAAIVINSAKQHLRHKMLQSDPEHSQPDDVILPIEKRVKIYATETLPVVEYLESKGLLTPVCLLLGLFCFVSIYIIKVCLCADVELSHFISIVNSVF